MMAAKELAAVQQHCRIAPMACGKRVQWSVGGHMRPLVKGLANCDDVRHVYADECC